MSAQKQKKEPNGRRRPVAEEQYETFPMKQDQFVFAIIVPVMPFYLPHEVGVPKEDGKTPQFFSSPICPSWHGVAI
jgi:hypothetical protein